MSDDITAVEDWASAFAARLAPSERRTLAKIIARDLRAAQQKRIAAQKDPDGNAFAARKPQPKHLRDKAGSIKRGAMFKKLALARRLKIITATGDEIAVGFTGRNADLARVHQDGEHAPIGKWSGAPKASYPQRRLLGYTEADSERMMQQVLDYINALGL